MLVVTDQAESERAFKALASQVRKLGQKHKRNIGYPGGHQPNLDVYWSEELAIWGHADDFTEDERFWICFGQDLGSEGSGVGITVETNPPKEGINRRTAGVFLKDGKDLYLGHSGKVGGGKKGIGKTEFLAWYDGSGIEEVTWPDGVQEPVVVIGRIRSELFLTNLAHFVSTVAAFKQRGGKNGSSPKVGVPTFSPECTTSSSYTQSLKEVDVKRTHGLVVAALKKAVKGGLNAGNDQQRDLYCVDKNNKVISLFEVKTSVDTTAIYTGVGQLMLHAHPSKTVRKVLVIPGLPKQPLRAALDSLGILVLSYSWKANALQFGKVPAELNDVLGTNL